MKKFLSDVLIECGLQVSGTTTLGTATATTVATSDNSTNIATTAWVKSLGYSTTDSFISGVALNGNSLDFTGINSAFTGSIDLSTINNFNASDVQTVYGRVKNVSGAPIFKGTPLAVVPGQTSGNISEVIPADAADPAKMPAIYIANEDIAEELEGEAVLFGEITGIDTSLYQSGTTVYVAAGGGWTDTKPDGTNLIQNLGIITKQHPSNGGGVVTGVGRANAVPNISNGHAWVGNANGVATPTLLGSLAYSSATYDNYGSWNLKTNGVQRTTVQSGGNLDIVAGTNVSVSYGAGGVVTISSTDTNTNNYLTGLSFATGTGVLTATRQGLSDLTVDLDGRYLELSGGTLYKSTASAGTTGTTFLEIHNYVGGDISQQQSFIDFKFTDTNANWTPQVRIGAQVGRDDDANAISKEGAGAFVVYTGNGTDEVGGGSLTEAMRVSYNGSMTVQNIITATGGNSTQWNSAYGWGDHAVQGYLTSYTEVDTLDTVADRGATTDKSLTIGNTLTLTRTGGVATLNTNTSGNDPQFIRFDESTDNAGYVWIAVSDDFDVSATNDVFYIGDSNLTDWRFKVLGSGAIYSREGTTERQLATRDWVTSQSYISGYTETDPIFTASAASGIAAGDITNWDSAYGWGNHGAAGYLLASQMTNYSLNPRFSTSIGFSNDTEILQFQDNNGQTKAGYWTSLDAFLINGDGNSNTNILLKTGNIYVNQNQFIVGKLGVQGLIELDNNSGVTLYSNGGTGDPVGTKIESFSSAAFIGAFLDFTIYDDGKDHMRSGTLQIVFNAAEVRFNEVNTLDIGDTSGCTLDVQNNGGVAEVYFTTPDPTFNIKYQVRTL